ncbi:MAG: acetyl-CoA carboxylase carboxyl transferase subunit alpha/beta [FCB group bacterium]|nr:acetyl-CoA carboxylase carboxyl transferase subunit alpha/beta [FCB group bacterium]
MNKHFYLPFEKNGPFDYDSLNEFEKYQLSFHPERPKYRDYLSIFSNVQECLASTEFGACLIQTHRANFQVGERQYPVLLIGQQTGPSSDYEQLIREMRDPEVVRKWNHGMPNYTSYERAIRAIELANREKRLIITMVDTPGADPTEESEAGGIAWRIGKTIQELVEAKVPTLSVIMNRGCSGGAIALTGCDVVLALEYSTYLVITPEACSSILFRTRSRANEAAEASRITSREGLELGIVDELVPEPKGPAHRYPREAIESLRQSLTKWIPELARTPDNELFPKRIERWRRIGRWEETEESVIRTFQMKKSRLPVPAKDGFVKRHKGCYTARGVHKYDPVLFDQLVANNYVCETCGHRYTRPSAWDYIDLILDEGSFREHRETRYIIDKDILGFPGYRKKLMETRLATGLATAMITGNGKVSGREVVYCGNDFGFLGGSFCMTTGEKIWRAAEIALQRKLPMVLQAAGGGARMHEGCSSMVSIPKAHVALTRVEQAGLPVITIITDPTLGGVAIGYGSRGIRLFEKNAGNIGFSGKRVIEQYTGRKTSRDFQTTHWLKKHGHVEHVVSPLTIKQEIVKRIAEQT